MKTKTADGSISTPRSEPLFYLLPQSGPPTSGLAHFNLAYALYRSGAISAARREAEEALRLLDLINDPEADEVRRQMSAWESENEEEQRRDGRQHSTTPTP